jgi:precorrin-4 methylase
MKSLRFMALSLVLLSFTLPAHGDDSQTKARGKLYVVGVGPAGPDLTAPRVLSVIEKADYFLCSPRLPERFARFGTHIDPAKVAFDPWERVFDDEAADQQSPEVRSAARERQRNKVQDFVLEKIQAGKTVVIMDGGDATVYGPTLNTLLQGLDDQYYEVLPGMGAVNAAAAALKRSLTCDEARFVLLTSPRSLFGREEAPQEDDILKDLAKYKSTMVLYMSLKNIGSFAEQLMAYYPADIPVAVVYYAGYEDKEFVLRSTLAEIEKEVAKMDEKWLGLVLIGDCIR